MKRFVGFFALTCLAALFIFSCKIGLGEAVDTQPPEIQVTAPEVASIIRDSFIIGGTWSDDGSIKPDAGLIIELARTDIESESYMYKGTIDKETWSCLINPFDSEKPLNDGEYLATITITDTYNHSTVKTVNFSIDNTNPIIVLQRPAAKKGDVSPDTYGQAFTLTGQAADDNNIDLIEVNLYSDESCETLLHTVRLENVPPTIELDVAKFAEGIENDYSKIYGSTSKSGTKNFYCQIVAYDGAQRFPTDGTEQTEADKRGNKTNHYYLYEEISSSILNDYKITEVYHMMNGNYKGGDDNSRAATISLIKETLDSNQIVTGFFSLNPANNPTFTVSGRESLKKDGTDFVGSQEQYISNGASVVIEVAAGLDAIPLEPESLKVYAIKCDNSGNIVNGAGKLYLDGTKSKAGTTYKFVIPVSSASGLELGSNYLFGVDGYDQKKNPVFASENGYGFHFTSSGSVPDLFVTSPSSSNVYKKAGDDVVISGYIDVDDGLPIISIIDGTNTLWTKNFTAADAIKTATNRKEYNFSYTIPASHFNQSQSKDYTITIKAINDELSANITKTIRYDVGKPLCEIIEFTPVVSNAAHENNINGIVKVRGTLSDEYTQMNFENHACRWEVYQDGAKVNGLGGDLASTFNFEINTTLLQDKKEATIKYIYQDSAGMSDVKEVTYFVDQDTDTPTLESVEESVWTKAVDHPNKLNEKLKAGDRTNTFSSKAQLSYIVADDDGIWKVFIKAYDSTGEYVSKDEDGNDISDQKINGKPTSITQFYEVPESSDQYKLTFEVYDVAFANVDFDNSAALDEAKELYARNYDIFDIWIQVAGAKPSITMNATPSCVTTNVENIAPNAKNEFTVTGTISGIGPFKLSFGDDPEKTVEDGLTDTNPTNFDENHNIEYKDSEGNWHPAELKNGKYCFSEEDAYRSKISWRDTFKPKSGTSSGTKSYWCYDKWSIDQKLDFNYEVDKVRPTVSINAIDDASNPGYPNVTKTQENQFTFRGTAIDTNEQIMQKIEIQFTESGKSIVDKAESSDDTTTNTVDATGWITASDLTSWNITVFFAQHKVFNKESPKDIYLRVTDAAGNYNENYTTKVASFNYDKAQPILSLDNPATALPKEKYTLNGKVVENYGFADSGKKVTITEWFKEEGSTGAYVKKDSKDAVLTETFAGSGIWTFSQELPFDVNLSGDLRYTFAATDANGKGLDQNVKMECNRDILPPEIAITNPNNSTYGENSVSGESTTIKGTIKESHCNKIYWAVVKNGDPATAPSTWETIDVSSFEDSVDKVWKTTVSFDQDETVRDGEYTLYVKAEDLGGNMSEIKTQKFMVDSAAPSLAVNVMGRATSDATTDTILTDTLSGSKTIKAIYGTTYNLSGSVSDTNGLKSFQVSIDEGSYEDVTVNDDGTWTVAAVTAAGATHATEGEHTYSFKVIDKTGRAKISGETEDVEGKVTEITKTVMFDLENPVVSIDELTADGLWIYATAKKPISGLASDASGLKKITLKLDGNAEVNVPTSEEWQKDIDFTNVAETTLAANPPNIHTLVITVTDKCEKTTTITRTFYLDKTMPKIEKFTYADSKSGTKYSNNSKNVKISGYAYDGAKTTKRYVTLALSAKDDNEQAVDIGNPTVTIDTSDSDYGKFTNVSVSTVELAEGDYTFILTATDSAGNEKEETFSVVIDKTAPTIGDISMSWGSSTENAKTIHNISNATFSLNPTDDNLDSVEYYIDDGSDSSITTSNWSSISDLKWSNVPAKISGSGYERSYKFSDGVGKVYIKVTDKAGNISYKIGPSYSVDMVAPDSCDVDTIDGAAPNGTKLINGKEPLTFTVIAKDFDYEYVGGSQKGLSTEKVASVNLKKIGETSIPVTGTATNPTTTKDKWTITIPADKFTGLSKGIKPLTVSVTDIAGNSKDFNIFSIDLDNEVPVTTISTPVTGNDVTVNGNQKISGIVTEDNPKTVALYYSKATSAPTTLDNWTLYRKYTTETGTDTTTVKYGKRTSEITNWSFPDFDFNSLSSAADETLKKHDIWLLAYAEDVAGNVSVITNPVKYHVDMDADRPVIKFSNLVLGASMAATNDTTRAGFENSEVYGSITDDDGVPDADKVFYQIVKKGESYNASNYVAAAADSNFVYSNGSFTLKFLDANKKADDGIKDIYFKVTDKAGTTFETKTGTTYNQSGIILSDGTNEYGTRPATASGSTKATVAYIKVDTQAPSVYTEAYYLGETAATAEADWSSGISAETFGGNQNKFFLYQYAYDANDVKSLVFRIPTDANDSTSKTAVNGYYVYNFTLKSGETKTSAGVTYTKWLSEQIDVTGFASGTRPCEFVASDGIKTKTTAVNISIDNTPPTVLVDSHTTDEQIRSSFALKGNFQDGDFGTSLKYIISTSAAEPDETAWSNATNVAGVTSMNWRIYFDNDNATGITVVDNETHDKQPKFNIVDLMSSTLTLNGDNQVVLKSNTSTKYTSLVRLYYHFKATDAIGNTSDDYVFSLKIDPQGDIPVILMSYPEVDKDANGNKKYGWYSVTPNTPLAAQWFYTNEPGTFGESRSETVQYKSGEDTLTGTFTYKYRGPTALLSGIIRTIGTAEDDKTISGLYMQIDPAYDPSGEGKFNANWATDLAAGNGEYTITSFGPAGNQKQGINMGNRTSWNLAINKNGEFNRSGNNYIAIRLYAVDVDGNVSATEDDDFFIVTIDSGAPKIGSTKQLYVYQYRWVSSSGAVVYTNKQNPTTSDHYYSDSGCRTAAGTIGSVASDGKSITAGGTNYTKDFNINEYIDGMWLKGEWWLSGSVEDENGIKAASMSVDGSTGKSIISGNDTNYNYLSANYIAESGKHDYLINYRVGSITSNAYGQIEYTLLVEDGDGQTTSKDFIINYDNKAPTVASNAAEGLAINKDIINDNGSYKVESTATEQSGESGFERVVFYFKRTLTGYKYVYDAYMQKDQATNKWRYEAENEESVNVIYDENTGLYWKEYTVQDSGGVQGRDVITVSNIDASVHKGTLAKIGGVIYTVTNVSSTSITLDGAPSEDLAGTKVYFVVGHVVDHVGTEGQGTLKQNTKTAYGYGYYSGADDDGDMMVEKISTVGTKTTWSGNINSQNIPDGPIEIHYVVFDKAGNSTHGVVDGAFVKNNAPRLASLRVWTDYNGNDKEDETESDTKYYNSRERKIGGKTTQRAYGVTENLVVSGNDLNYDDANATAFKRVTDKTRFYPEIVGGNGHLYYSYKIGTGTDPDNWNKKTGNGGSTPFTASATRVEADSSAYMATDQNGESYVSGSASDKIEVSISILSEIGNSPDNGPTWFEYTIWDSTPGTTRYATDGTGSLTAKFTVALKVAYVDTVAPKAVISPFFWKGQGKGTVQNADGTTSQIPLNSLYDGDKANGHIELENDLTGTLAATIYGDTDPKVSGKITIRGTAYDDIRLSQLWVKFDGVTLESALTGTNPDSTNHPGYVLAATYDTKTSKWTAATATMSTKGWEFSATDEYCTSDGHKVNWEFSVNTAKHSNVSEKNVKAYVMSVAERGSETAKYSSVTAAGSDPTNDAQYNKPAYQMDIVPYISTIKTSDRTNSGLKDNNIRSASGKYSIIKGNSTSFITVEGLNLNPGASDVRLYTTAQKEASGSTNQTGIQLTRTAANATHTSFSVSNAIANSGYIEVFVNGNRAMNNINKNEAHGSYAFTGGTQATPAPTVSDYKEMPNREADYDVTKNVQLTDDRYLRIFDMKDTGIKNGYYPVMMMGRKNDGSVSDNPVFGYVDLNGMNNSVSTFNAASYNQAQYMVQRAEFNASTGNTSDIEYLIGGMTWDQMAMARDSTGKYIHASVFNQNNAKMTVVYDRFAEITTWTKGTGWNTTTYYDGWGTGSYWTNWSNDKKDIKDTACFSENGSNNAIDLESIGYNENGGSASNLVGRYQGMKMISLGDSTTDTGSSNYLVYYDDNTANKNIIFRTFKVGTNKKWTNKMANGAYSNLADGNTDGRNVAATKATKYFDFGVTSDKRVVIVYYNTAGELKLAYSNNNGIDGSSLTGIEFTTSNLKFTNYIGQYVSMAIDGSNHIHIAAFDANKSSLRYIYVDSYNATTCKEMTVDASTSVGKWTKIKLHNGLPYIAYYNSAEDGQKEAIRLAYPAANITSVADITDGYDANNYATGSWEYMTVPSLTPAQGGDAKFQSVCLDFDSNGKPVVGYLGTNLEFGKYMDENSN